MSACHVEPKAPTVRADDEVEQKLALRRQQCGVAGVALAHAEYDVGAQAIEEALGIVARHRNDRAIRKLAMRHGSPFIRQAL